ncbi:MAG TPA: nitrite/sulfite reductase, partial [Burkholderiales bacterium]|nr:nitrite/sulfite reductase [Burkholderiales bacterium]
MEGSVSLKQGLAALGEIDQYARDLESFRNLEIDADRFTAIRLQMGCYGQRQEGVNMLRIKIPGGRLRPAQLRAIGGVLDKYSQHETAHVTTRQDIQIHHIPLERTPEAMRDLARAGLTTREACGNTIRNISACSLAGVCSKEHTDVTHHLQTAVHHFLRNPLNQQMPRKFKVSFSGCESDCAQGMIHDLGIVALPRKDETGVERFGFKILAAGGLGHKPHEAIVVESFIEERDLIIAMEAVVTLHNKYSDRTKRAKSRIKFLVDRFGAEGFLERYRDEFARIKNALGQNEFPAGEWRTDASGAAPGPGAPRKVHAQKQVGLSVLPLSLPIGNLTVAQLRGVADIADEHALNDLQTTQDQNLILRNVPDELVPALLSQFEKLGLGLPKTGDDVVACPGTSTGRLGITSSTTLGPMLSGGEHDLRIRVSGCHNGCAQPESGDIGIYGEGRRLHGKLVPHYQIYLGGDGTAGGAIGRKGPSVPSARIEDAIERIKRTFAQDRIDEETFFSWSRRQDADYFKNLLADLIAVKPEDVPGLLRDHGDAADFRVLQLGGGECAGASQQKIGTLFFDAAHERNYRDALKFQRKYPEALSCAEAGLQAVARAVADSAAIPESEDLASFAGALASALPEARALAGELKTLAAAVTSEEAPGEPDISALFSRVDKWIVSAADLCQRRDPT